MVNPPVDLIDRIFSEEDDAPEEHDPTTDPLDDVEGELVSGTDDGTEADKQADNLTDIETVSLVLSTIESAEEVAKQPVTDAALVPAQPLTEEELQRRQIDEERHSDAVIARQNLKNMIKHGETLLNSLVLNCGASDDPKFFAAAAQMLKEVSSMNKDLLRLHRAEQELKDMNNGKAKEEPAAPVQIDKAVIVSSPSELLAAVKNKK